MLDHLNLLAYWYLGWGTVSFILYGRDKYAAQSSKGRTPEAVLLLSDLIGGWILGKIAQNMFNHKTSKQSYQAKFVSVALLNIIGLFTFLWYT